MINFINSWVQGIIIAVVISTIIEMILPKGTIKKYVKTVIGVYIIFVIISPLITKLTGKEINFSKYKLPEIEKPQTTIDTNAYIESTYINKIKKEIMDTINKEGYNVENIELEIETKEENYGNIKKIELIISNKNNKISNIEPVNIDITSDNKKENITEEEKQKVKNNLKEIYGAENILIN